MAEEDLKVEDDKAVDVEAKADDVAPEAEPEDEGIAPEAGIEELKRNLELAQKAAEEERQRRLQMEQLAQQAQQEAYKSQLGKAHAEFQSVKDSIAFIRGREGHILEEWKEAKSMGDYTREAELQREMYNMQDALNRLEGRRQQYEQFFQNPPQPQAPQRPQNEFEAWVSQQTRPTAEWAMKHPELFQSEDKKNLVAAAHYKALGMGLRVDSDAYFRAVEDELGLRKPSRQVEDEGDESPLSSASAPRRASAPPPSAPVSRGGTRKGAVNLSPAEREAAEISGVTYEEYARNKEREKERERARR